MYDFYFDSMTEKNSKEINFIDLEKTYHLLDHITCFRHQQESKRVGLLKMFMNGNKINDVKQLLNQYSHKYKDSVFYNSIEDQFSINDSTLMNRNLDGSYVDIYDQDKTYNEFILERLGNVILIDFWASWCGPCRKNMPAVKKLEQKYGDQDFEIIYISIDKYPDQWKKASKDEDIWHNNNYWAYNFQDSEVYKNFGITEIPRYIIYDKDGKVAYHKGPKPNAMEDIIEQLLLE